MDKTSAVTAPPALHASYELTADKSSGISRKKKNQAQFMFFSF